MNTTPRRIIIVIITTITYHYHNQHRHHRLITIIVAILACRTSLPPFSPLAHSWPLPEMSGKPRRKRPTESQ
eukprot:4565872-Pyramimonas_sp.AAC.1